MVTIDLCGKFNVFRRCSAIQPPFCVYMPCAHKGKHKYLHAYKQSDSPTPPPPYAKFVVCKLWPHFVYFSRIFAKQPTHILCCIFFLFSALRSFGILSVFPLFPYCCHFNGHCVLVLAYADCEICLLKLPLWYLLRGNVCETRARNNKIVWSKQNAHIEVKKKQNLIVRSPFLTPLRTS